MITLDRPTLTARALEDLTASALVVGVGTGPDGPVLLTDALPAEAATALEASFELLGVRGAEDEVHRLPGLGGVPVPLLVLAGVGGLDDDGEASDESLRRAAGAAVRSLAGTDAVALALPAARVDLAGRVPVFETLKKRRDGVYRAVPVPPQLLGTLDLVHGMHEARRRGRGDTLLWLWSRMTTFRRVREVDGWLPGFRKGRTPALRGCGTA